jgi:hypothetical protein
MATPFFDSIVLQAARAVQDPRTSVADDNEKRYKLADWSIYINQAIRDFILEIAKGNAPDAWITMPEYIKYYPVMAIVSNRTPLPDGLWMPLTVMEAVGLPEIIRIPDEELPDVLTGQHALIIPRIEQKGYYLDEGDIVILPLSVPTTQLLIRGVKEHMDVIRASDVDIQLSTMLTGELVKRVVALATMDASRNVQS